MLKEDLQGFRACCSPTVGNRFLKRRCRQAFYSRLEPLKKVAGMLRRHRPLLRCC